MLCNSSRRHAVEYLHQVFDQVVALDELLQFSIIEFIRKDSKTNPPEKVIWDMLV
jgi:coatomer subunit beta